MCLRLEKNKKGFGYVSVFLPIELMHLISTLSHEQDTIQAKYGRVSDSQNLYKWKFWTYQTKIKT
jgi:hypothetical protein